MKCAISFLLLMHTIATPADAYAPMPPATVAEFGERPLHVGPDAAVVLRTAGDLTARLAFIDDRALRRREAASTGRVIRRLSLAVQDPESVAALESLADGLRDYRLGQIDEASQRRHAAERRLSR